MIGSLLSIFISMLSFVAKVICVIAAVIVVLFGIPCGLWFLYFRLVKKMRIPKRTIDAVPPHYTSKRSPLLRLFWDFPRRLVLDKFTLDPDRFDTYGIHVFCGEQGSGKSIAAIHFIKMIKERNPACKIASNIDLDFMDSLIDSSDEIISSVNGSFGQVVYLDEIQNWFSSMESKNFPPEMLTEVTQHQKPKQPLS